MGPPSSNELHMAKVHSPSSPMPWTYGCAKRCRVFAPGFGPAVSRRWGNVSYFRYMSIQICHSNIFKQ